MAALMRDPQAPTIEDEYAAYAESEPFPMSWNDWLRDRTETERANRLLAERKESA
jgi:NADH:ubiquinone oxidoreductase subunit